MLIEMRHIGKSRKLYKCGDCGKYIPVGSEYVDLYGAAYSTDKPWHLKLCVSCIKRLTDSKNTEDCE